MPSEKANPGRTVTSREPRAVNSSHILTLLVFTYILVFMTAWGHSRDGGSPAPGEPGVARPATADELAPVSVPEPSSEAMQYYRSGNWFWVINRLWALIIPGFLAFTGFSARLRNLAHRAGRGWFLTIGIYMLMFMAVIYVLDLPLSYYQGFVRQHAYGLSNQSLTRWLRNSIVRLAVDMGVAFALVWMPYLLMARSPRRWWLYAAILSVPFLLFTMMVVPVFYDPLFNQFGPMKNKELERSILALASRAGIERSRVFEVDKSADTNAVNAYVTGFWQSKRVVLWDTLIKKLDEPELLVVMGHEMGHYALGHVVRSILMSSVLTFVGLFLVDRIGRWLVWRYRKRLGFEQLADIASVPLLMMLLELVFVVLSPVGLAYSRYQEHEADRYALNLTRSNHAAGTAHVKLLTENLGNPRPGILYKIFRASHPTAGERIDFANSYHPWRVDRVPDLESSRQQSIVELPGSALTQRPARKKYSGNVEMEAPSERH
jgi:STE24 endopeptidase